MNFISTRGGKKVTGAEAIVKGLAENGGLYVPEKFPKITKEELEKMAEMNYAERAAFVLGKYLADDLGEAFLLETCEKAYSAFEGKDPVPLVKIDGNMYALPARSRIWRLPCCRTCSKRAVRLRGSRTRSLFWRRRAAIRAKPR